MKRKLDKFIEVNYTKLINITNKKIRKYNRKVDGETMLAAAYIYVCENLDKLKTKEDIPKFLVHYIDVELRFPKSNTNRKKAIDNCIEYWEWNSLDTSFEIDVDSLDFKECLVTFVESLDRVDQIIWKVYFEYGKTKVRELSDHFNIPESTIYLYRVRVLDKFKQHYINHYEY